MVFAEFADDFGSGQVLLSLFWFFLFFIWIWLLITVFIDIFRSDDLSGLAKAGWAIGLIILPYIGVFIYLVVRGGKMGARAASDARARDSAFRSYVQDAAGGGSEVDQLGALHDLREKGAIDDAEYGRLKAKVLAD